MFTLDLPGEYTDTIKELILSHLTTEMECYSCGHKWSQRGEDQLFAATVNVSPNSTLCHEVQEILSGNWEDKSGCCPKCHSKCQSPKPNEIHSCQSIGM